MLSLIETWDLDYCLVSIYIFKDNEVSMIHVFCNTVNMTTNKIAQKVWYVKGLSRSTMEIDNIGNRATSLWKKKYNIFTRGKFATNTYPYIVMIMPGEQKPHCVP